MSLRRHMPCGQGEGRVDTRSPESSLAEQVGKPLERLPVARQVLHGNKLDEPGPIDGGDPDSRSGARGAPRRRCAGKVDPKESGFAHRERVNAKRVYANVARRPVILTGPAIAGALM